MGEHDEITIHETEILVTKGDKARGAAELGQKLVKVGVRKEIAANQATHELKHGLTDKGSGTMGARLKPSGNWPLMTFYKQVGPKRTAMEQLAITEAPGADMSPYDIERSANLRNQIARERNPIRRIIKSIRQRNQST